MANHAARRDCATGIPVDAGGSCAAPRATAALGLRLPGADECAREAAFDLRREAIDIDTAVRQERARVIDLVNAPGFDLDIRKAGATQLGAVLRLPERARDTAHPQLHAAPDVSRYFAPDDDVRDRKSPTRLQHTEGLAQNRILAAGQVDDAVRDDDVDRVIGQGNGFDGPLEELAVGGSWLALVLLREREHLVGHVETVRLAAGAHAFRR